MQISQHITQADESSHFPYLAAIIEVIIPLSKGLEHAMKELEKLLQEAGSRHVRLCPRQVLGVRMGRYAGALLGLALPQSGKRLLTILETDGCFASAVSVATGCWVGRRTLRVEDYGKVAATFVDTETGRSIRIAPRDNVRTLAKEYAPNERSRWHTQLVGYQKIPYDLLFSWQELKLHTPIEDIVSRPGIRTNCQICGEEIMNEREVHQDGQTLCRSCAGNSYYEVY